MDQTLSSPRPRTSHVTTQPRPLFGARIKRILFWCALIVGLLLLAEGVLQILVRSSRSIDAVLALNPPAPTVEDRTLVWRGNPDYPQHDQRGFRNSAVPAQASLVTLGDSQTYGSKIQAEEAWPHQLERLTSLGTYNMAFPGWGPAQSLLVLDEALDFKPTAVLEGLYTGNDLFDAFTFVYHRKRLGQFRTPDPAAQAAIAAREKADPLDDNALADQGPSESKRARVSRPDSLLEWARQNSKLYGLWNAVRRAYNFYQRHQPGGPDDGPDDDQIAAGEEFPFDDGTLSTVLTPAYREIAVNLDDPRTAEGLRIMLEVYGRMSDQCAARGARFAVVLIPTKEYVLRDAVEGQLSGLPPVYERMTAEEETVHALLRRELEARQIPLVDATPALRDLAANDTLPYSSTRDGHLSPADQRAVAALVRATLSL
jgi:hypothetical protein